MHLRPPDYFVERPFGSRKVALCRPHHCHDAQILGVVDRIGDEAAQRSERVQVLVRQIQLATQGVELRPRPQRQRLERTIARCFGPLYRLVDLRRRAVDRGIPAARGDNGHNHIMSRPVPERRMGKRTPNREVTTDAESRKRSGVASGATSLIRRELCVQARSARGGPRVVSSLGAGRFEPVELEA